MPTHRTHALVSLASILVITMLLPLRGDARQDRQTHPERYQFTLSDSVRVVRDLTYANYGDRQLKLDLYLPKGLVDPTPGVIVIRGGGWRSGDKEGFAHIAGFLAKEGLAAASIEYRASGEAKFPAAIHDVKAAIRWMRANGGQYAIDVDRIGAIGGSAGAHLAAAGTSYPISELEGEGGNPDASSEVQAVVAMAVPADFGSGPGGRQISAFMGGPFDEQLWRLASPITHVHGGSPPILLIHSRTDRTVPYRQSVRLAEEYRERGASVELVPIPDAPHAFWNLEQWHEDVMSRAASFFKSTLGAAPNN